LEAEIRRMLQGVGGMPLLGMLDIAVDAIGPLLASKSANKM